MSVTEHNHQQSTTTPSIRGAAEDAVGSTQLAHSKLNNTYNLCHSELRVKEHSVFKDSSLHGCAAVVRRVVAGVSKHRSTSVFRVLRRWRHYIPSKHPEIPKDTGSHTGRLVSTAVTIWEPQM
jgi:hypothetical protein